MSLSSAAAKASFRYPSNNLLRSSTTPSSGRAKLYQKSQNRRDSTFTSIGDTSSINSEEDESYARTDYGLESPTIVSHLIETVRKESKMTQNGGPNDAIPPPLGFDEFQTLSSTKQNIELFKILNAIGQVSHYRLFS